MFVLRQSSSGLLLPSACLVDPSCGESLSTRKRRPATDYRGRRRVERRGELACPSIGYAVTLNPTCYLTIVDRYRMLHGDRAFVEEFYPSVKKAVEFMVDLNRGPDGIVSMADRLVSVWPGVQ